jgi:hypothetical protein
MNKLWRAPSLRGPWTLSGAHFASNRTVLEHRPAGGDRHDEFTTPDFFGALQGDPRGGRTRVFTTTMVDTMFFLGRRRRKAGAFGTTGRLMVRLSPLKTAAGPEPRQGRATTAAIRAAAPAAAAWAGVGRAAGRGARPVRQGAWRRQHRRVRRRSRSEPHEQPGLHHSSLLASPLPGRRTPARRGNATTRRSTATSTTRWCRASATTALASPGSHDR